jgi:hypothetical protein
MKKNQMRVRRLAVRGVIVRTLGGVELSTVAGGWECSAKTSGNILCSQLTNSETEGGEPPTDPQP